MLSHSLIFLVFITIKISFDSLVNGLNIKEQTPMDFYVYKTKQVQLKDKSKMLIASRINISSYNTEGNQILEPAFKKKNYFFYEVDTILTRSLNGNLIYICNRTLITMMNDTGYIFYEYIVEKSSLSFCSFDEVKQESSIILYLIGFKNETKLNLHLFKNTENIRSVSPPLTISIDSKIPSLCQFLTKNQLIFCIVDQLPNFFGIYFDYSLKETKERRIIFDNTKVVRPDTLKLLRVEDDNLIMMHMSTSEIFYAEVTSSTISAWILVHERQMSVNVGYSFLTIAYLAYGSMMYCSSTSKGFVIQRLQTNKKIGRAIEIDTFFWGSYPSIGLFSPNLFGIIYSHYENGAIPHTSLFIFNSYPVCIDDKHYTISTKTSSGIYYVQLIDNYDLTETYYIEFKAPTNFTGLIPGKSSQIDHNKKFTSSVTGYFEVTFTIQTNVTHNGSVTDQMAESFYCKAYFKVCYDTCVDCDEFGDSTNHRCTQCIPGYKALIAISMGNCITIDQCKNSNYLIGNYCVSRCPSFSYSNKTSKECEKCPSQYLYHKDTLECISIEDCKNLNYFWGSYFCHKVCPFPLYSNPISRQCIPTCQSDNYIYNNTDCITDSACKNMSYYIDLTGPNKTCVEICDPLYSNTKNQQCVTSCPIDTYVLEKDCLSLDDCIDKGYYYFSEGQTNKCVLSCPTPLYKNKQTQQCVQKCPFYGNDSSNECYSIDDCKHNGLYLYTNGSISQCYTECPYHLYIIKHNKTCVDTCDDYVYFESFLKECLSFDDCLLEHSYAYTATNNTNICTDICSSPLYIDRINNQCVTDCPNGFVPDDIKIECIEYVPSIDNSLLDDYIVLQEMNSINIDITDDTHAFFNDICFPFTSMYHTDVPIEYRHTYYLNPSKFCDSDCEFKEFDLIKNIAVCNCDLSFKTIKNSSRKVTQANNGMNRLFSFSNIQIASCFHLVFNREIIANNIGHWLIVFAMSINVGIFLRFVFFGFSSLLNYFLKIYNKAKYKFPKTSTMQRMINNNNDNGIRVHNSDCPQSIDLFRLMNLSTGNSPRINRNKELTYEELNDMEYTEAILEDHRSLRDHYINVLSLYHPIIFTFYTVSYKRIATIKISVFFLTKAMILGCNAVLYNTSYIINTFESKGKNNIIEHLPKCCIAYVMVGVIKQVLFLLAYDDRGIRDMQNRTSQSILIRLNSFMKCYRIKVLVYFFIQFSLMLACWYYVTAFCSVYKNNQINLLISSVITFSIEIIMPLLSSFVIASLKYLSIKYKKRWLYRFCFVFV